MSYSRPPMPLPRPSNESNVFVNARISSNLQIPNIFISNKQTPTPNPTNHNGSFPLPTNNHLTSLLVPSENAVPSYVQPFLYTLLPDPQGVKSIIAISSAHADQKVIGDHYAYNPVGIHELTITNLGSCNVSNDGVLFPKGRVGLIQGQGSVTVELTSAEGVILDSAVGIRNVYDVKGGEGRCFGIELNSGRKWIVYVEALSLNVQRDGNTGMYKMNVVGHEGIVQLYPDTDPKCSLLGMDFNGLGNLLKLGNYARSLTVSTASGSNNVLQFEYDMRYKDRDGLIFLLPHHQSDVIAQTADKADLKLYSTVYGYMQGYYTKGTVSFDYSRPEDDLSDYDILSESKQSIFHQKLNTFLDNLSPIKDILINNDISECMNNLQNESNLDSMYFSGKIFNKYVWLLFIAEELLHDTELSNKLFTKITECLNKFIQNQQILPLLYDQKWGGIISSGDMGQDFGNSMYNDHHFHYGYFVLTFAILGWYNPKWFEENRFYSDLLLRDYCNIDDNDKAFTKFRNFSWFEGHSWANGVWPSLDGRDQESSSEDYNSVYAMYLYGSMTKNEKMKQIAKLQLNIMKRSNNAYFLYKDRDLGNEVAISEMKKNKVCGIFFQNKIDYATYFGLNTEYIHMIHFIPGTFITRYIRDNEFVTEEWNQKLQNINIDNNGWNGLLKLNRALISPDTIDFFKNPNFNKADLDNGQSQTLSLILALLWNN